MNYLNHYSTHYTLVLLPFIFQKKKKQKTLSLQVDSFLFFIFSENWARTVAWAEKLPFSWWLHMEWNHEYWIILIKFVEKFMDWLGFLWQRLITEKRAFLDNVILAENNFFQRQQQPPFPLTTISSFSILLC